MRLDGAEAQQGDRVPGTAHHPRREPERVPALTVPLELREPEPLALPLPLLRLDEVAERPVQVAERLLVGALGVLSPPGKRRVGLLRGIPELVKLGRRIPRAFGF